MSNRTKSRKLLVFSGGTGFREINMSLARRGNDITRIVPVCDNGGSSKVLRQHFNVIPIGDIRHALMTQAHGEGRVGSVVKLFNWRLSGSGTDKLLKKELNSFITNQHPLISNIEKSLGNVIVNYLNQFSALLPPDMELRNGSIGNFVLLGAYFAHNKDINTAIYVFRQLCSIQGNVWPVSLDNDLHLQAALDNGDTIFGQANTTNIDRSKYAAKIDHILFSHSDEKTEIIRPHVTASANPIVIEAIKTADIIVYGPGSFFTSLLPHIMTGSIAQEIAKLNIPKIFIGNILEDDESYGYDLEQMVRHFVTTANQYSSQVQPINKYISHLLVNKSHSLNEHTTNNHFYLKMGENINAFDQQGIELVIDDMESPWKRGQHDADWIADYLTHFP